MKKNEYKRSSRKVRNVSYATVATRDQGILCTFKIVTETGWDLSCYGDHLVQEQCAQNRFVGLVHHRTTLLSDILCRLDEGVVVVHIEFFFSNPIWPSIPLVLCAHRTAQGLSLINWKLLQSHQASHFPGIRHFRKHRMRRFLGDRLLADQPADRTVRCGVPTSLNIHVSGLGV